MHVCNVFGDRFYCPHSSRLHKSQLQDFCKVYCWRVMWWESKWKGLLAAHLSTTGLSDMQSFECPTWDNPRFTDVSVCLCVPGLTHACIVWKEDIVPGHGVPVTPLVSKCFYQSWDYCLSSVCVRRETCHVTQGRRNKLAQWCSQWLLGSPCSI